MKNAALFIFSLIISLIFLTFIAYEFITTYHAHDTFAGYCSWRGLNIVNQTSAYGYCHDRSGHLFKIVNVNNRWYFDGDTPNSWPF